MYKKYQVSIHHDPPEKVTKSQFKRFLCNSSLLHESDEEDEDASRGAFHMQVLEFGLHLHYLLFFILFNGMIYSLISPGYE